MFSYNIYYKSGVNESLKNITPADVYFEREKELLNQRIDTKMKTMKERWRKNQKIRKLA